MSFVPLSSTTPLNQYTATASQTTFPYTWLAFAEADIKVYVNDVLKTLTTHYTISAVNDEDGGNVIFNSGLTVGDKVTITRDISIARLTGFVESGGSISPAALNIELNRILAVIQENKRDQDRTVSLAASDTTTGDMVLPTKASRLGMLFGFHATTGLPTVIDPSTLSPNLTAAVTDAETAQTAAEAARDLASASAAAAAQSAIDAEAHAPAGWGLKYAAITSLDDTDSPYDIIAGDDGKLILCDATSGAITVNLPAADTNTGFVVWVKKSDSSANAITIDGNAAETIDGRTSGKLLSQYDWVGLYCNGTGWNVIACGYTKTSVIYTTGANTFTTLNSVPLGCSKIRVHVMGGGGGGGGGNNTTNVRGTGGGGGYSRKEIATSALGTTETATVGAGGAGGAVGNPAANGSVGGTSSFGAHCSATGGAAGTGQTGSSAIGGSAGGVGADGDLNLTGGVSQTWWSGTSTADVSEGGACPFIGTQVGSVAANAPANSGAGGACGNHTSGSGGTGGSGLIIVEIL